MSVLSGLTTGASKAADLGAVLQAATLLATRLDCQIWWEHVDSDANPADGGSRVGITCPVARDLGVKLMRYEFPDWPANVLDVKPDEWLQILGLF